MDSGMSELTAVLGLYQTQYSDTDKLWAYFSTATLALLGFSIGADKALQSFRNAAIIVLAYLVFCYGNLKAITNSQDQLKHFSDLAAYTAGKHGIPLADFEPISASDIRIFYWAVVAAVSISILFITYSRQRPGKPGEP